MAHTDYCRAWENGPMTDSARVAMRSSSVNSSGASLSSETRRTPAKIGDPADEAELSAVAFEALLDTCP